MTLHVMVFHSLLFCSVALQGAGTQVHVSWKTLSILTSWFCLCEAHLKKGQTSQFVFSTYPITNSHRQPSITILWAKDLVGRTPWFFDVMKNWLNVSIMPTLRRWDSNESDVRSGALQRYDPTSSASDSEEKLYCIKMVLLVLLYKGCFCNNRNLIISRSKSICGPWGSLLVAILEQADGLFNFQWLYTVILAEMLLCDDDLINLHA